MSYRVLICITITHVNVIEQTSLCTEVVGHGSHFSRDNSATCWSLKRTASEIYSRIQLNRAFGTYSSYKLVGKYLSSVGEKDKLFTK